MGSKSLSLVGLLALAFSLTSCMAAAPDSDVSSEEENIDSRGRSIIGGTKASAYPEAVLVDLMWNGQVTYVCSGAVIAPRVVLTAGHCVVGANGWRIRAPFANGQTATASESATYDYTSGDESVPFDQHDVGLVFLKTSINLTTYPTIATAKLADNSSVVNLGRVKGGVPSNSTLYVSSSIKVRSAANAGYAFDYIATEVIESGDSGGPDFVPGTHNIVAVNSGGGGGTEVLARVDLVASWIQQQITAHGGSGGGTTVPAPTCAHDTCASGAKLASSCDPCVQQICAADSFCCSNSWDAQCVSQVQSICGKTTCSASGGGTTDPCNGVTFAGKCEGNTVKWCEGGLKSLACGAKHCGFDGQNGYYNCL